MEPRATWPTGLIEVGAGVFAYVQAGGEAGISNAGLILGPDQAVVVDALATTPMATAFLGHIRRVTSLPITHVILTHNHVDHFLGIQNFLPAQVISHASCREEMANGGPDAAERWSKRRPQFAEGLTGVRVCLPNVAFHDRMSLYLGNREIQLIHLGMGHTRGDTLVFLPEEKILFAGDIAFHKVTPQGFQGDIGKWISVVDQVLKMDVEIVVPGHGPSGTKADLAEMRDYLQLVYKGARRCFDLGLTEARAIESIDLGKYRAWTEAERIKDNVERAYREFKGELSLS
jgi:cyclase